jgi:1,4-dihydroxy-2-naphthoate octaprenyltransferase
MNPLIVLRIIRPHIVAGGILAYSLGVLLALVEGGTLNLPLIILGYGVVFLGDLSTHFSNDYFDVELDSQVKSKKFFSGKKILVNNPQLLPLTKNISLILLVLSIVLSAVVVIFFGAPIEFLVITVAANFLGWAYSAPPIRLSSRGLGELTIAAATGFIIPSIGYLSVKGQLNPIFLSLSIPFMLYGFFLSLNLEAPDIESDQKGRKRTLAVRTGKRNVFIVVLAVPLFAALTFLVLFLQFSTGILDLKTLFLFSLIPVAASIIGFVTFFQKRALNRFSTLNICSLFLLITFLNVYLYLLLP